MVMSSFAAMTRLPSSLNQALAPASLIGEVARVRIVEAGTNSLFGELADSAPSMRAAARLAAGGA